MDPRHRRRRAGAGLVALAALVLAGAGGVLTAPGSHSARPPRRPPTGPPRVPVVARRAVLSPAAREHRAELAAIDRVLARMPFVRIAGSRRREIALTFDDGPGPYTPAILRVLERRHVPATFFEVGFMERWFHAATTRIVADGDVIGDHTEAHAPMSELRAAAQRAQLLEDAQAIERYGAPFPRLFRPPYGLYDRTTLALLHRYRMLMILWTVDTRDYLRPGVRAIVRRALAGARPGAIILLHDAGGNRSQTVRALPLIIAALRARGYQLVTVPKLLLDDPPPADQNIVSVPAGGG